MPEPATTSLSLIALAPILLLAAAMLFAARPGRRHGRLPLVAEVATLASFGLGLGGLLQLWFSGPQVTTFGGLAIVRLDATRVTIALVVSFVG